MVFLLGNFTKKRDEKHGRHLPLLQCSDTDENNQKAALVVHIAIATCYTIDNVYGRLGRNRQKLWL